MSNLQNIIEENKKSLNDTSLFRAGGSCWEVCDFEAICEDIKENNHLSQLRLIEGFREMVRERIGMVDIAIKSVDEKEGLDSYFGGQKLILNRLLSELGSINEIK
jgi:hypothetical protein